MGLPAFSRLGRTGINKIIIYCCKKIQMKNSICAAKWNREMMNTSFNGSKMVESFLKMRAFVYLTNVELNLWVQIFNYTKVIIIVKSKIQSDMQNQKLFNSVQLLQKSKQG